MEGKIRKRFLAFILTVILMAEPEVMSLGGGNVWGSGWNGEQAWLEDMASWNGISGGSISSDEILDETLSDDLALGGEVLNEPIPDMDVSENEIPEELISDNVISIDEISENQVSENEIMPEVVSDNSLSGNETQKDSVSENNAQEKEGEKAAAVCKVTFDSQKGSAVGVQTVPKGGKAAKPANPVRSKYIFSGWYKGNKKYDFGTPVLKNIKLTAQWKKVTVGKSQVKKLTNPSKGVLKVKAQKVSGAKGYEIQVSTDKTFKTKKETYLSSTATKAIGDRQKNKTYYVRVRAYKLDSKGEKVYGKFNGRKSLKIKKGVQKVDPSAAAGTIKSVILTSKKTVQVKAKVAKYVKSVDNYYYLFHLNSSAGNISNDAKPDAKVKKKVSMTMKTSLDYNTASSKLQSKFVLAVKTAKPGTYTIICTPQFISNPEKLASYNYGFPKSSTKKGLQVNPAYLEDAVELGVKHTAYNICLDDLIARPEQKNEEAGIPFSYNGTEYWFNRSIVEGIDHGLQSFKQNQMVVSAILLMRWRDDLSYLVPRGAREPGHSYYALNTSEEKARRHWEAVFTFLAQRYTSNGLVANWILGNEVNNYQTYHYTGSTVLASNVKTYTDAYRLAYIAMRSVYARARIYISLDQVWTYLAAGSHMGKQFLETFASYWYTYGNMGNFHIAFHPYPAPLEDPAFWTNSKGLVTNNINSPCISMLNLQVFTNYVKQKWGKNTRIILSEQGFTSKRYGVDVHKLQAAAIAYAYYLAEFNDSVDAFILHRHVDHQAEEDQGLYLGLWSNNGDRSNPAVIGSKKYAWEIFKEMDTSKGHSKTKFALTHIGASSWKSIVPGYDRERFS